MEFSDNVEDCGGMTFSYTFTASNVIIKGGRLIVGWPDNPFQGDFDLEIGGSIPYMDESTRSPLNGARNVLGMNIYWCVCNECLKIYQS